MKKILFYATNLIIILCVITAAAFCADAVKAPSAKTPPAKADFFDFSADSIRASEDSVYASGNVVFEQKGVKVKTGEAKYNNKTNLLTCAGEVFIEYNGDKYKGKRLIYNAKTYEAALFDVSGSIRNLSFEKGVMMGQLIFDCRKMLSDSADSNLYNVKATTCELVKPHYFIEAKRITVFIDDKLVIRDASFYFNNKLLFNLPSLVYSLKPRDARQSLQNALPKMSSNTTDGFVIKESLNYLWGKRDYGTVKVDWYQNSGVGLGLDHYFDFMDKGDAAIHYYKLDASTSNRARHEYSARLNYLLPMDIKLGYLFNAGVYQLPDQTSYPTKTSSVSLSRADDRSSFTASSVLYNVGFNLNQGYNFYQTYALSKTLTSYFNFDYSKNFSASGSETYNAHPILRLYNRGKIFDTQLSYERTGGSLQNGLNREPELSVMSHRIPAGFLDIQVFGSYGLFRQKPDTNSITRSYAEFALPYKAWKLSNKVYVDSNSFASKYWYSGPNSYRVLFNKTGLACNLSNFSNLRADFFYQSPKGYAAIDVDKLNYYKLLMGTVNLFDGKNYYLSAGSSYNLAAEGGRKWKDLFCRTTITPGNFGVMNFGLSYNTQTRHWQNLDAQMDLMLGKTLNVRYWAEYDISTRTMITQDYSIIKDFHCWEARLVYRGFTSQWWFDVVLKAFPSEDITIGANQTKPILPEEGWQRF